MHKTVWILMRKPGAHVACCCFFEFKDLHEPGWLLRYLQGLHMSTIRPSSNRTTTNINCPSPGSTLAYSLMNCSGFILNVVLVVVVLKHTNATLRPYAEVLLTSCGIDIFSSFFQFLTQARPTFQGDKGLLTFSIDGVLPRLVSNTTLFRGGNLNYILIPEYIGCYFSVCYCCVPFVFRYLMICWNHQMRRFEFYGLVIILFALSVFCSVTINYASAGVYDINMDYVPIPNPNCTRYLPQFSARLNTAERQYQRIFELWGNGTMVILSTYIITLFCLIRIQIFFCMQRSDGNNDVQTRIQHQISLTLALQAITPLLAFYGPQTSFIILLRFGVVWMQAFELLFISYAAIPILNSLTVFVLIASYRSAFFTLASNVGQQILTTVRLSRYMSGGEVKPLFVETAKEASSKKTTNNNNSFLVVQDF